MSAPRLLALRLETLWEPPSDGKDLSYILCLKNSGAEPISGFALCVSGPGRVDPAGRVEGATIARRLSNFTEFHPPAGFVLGSGETWTIAVHALSWNFRHWTDGATSAYLVLADGRTISLGVEPTRSTASNAPLKRGAELYPVPANAPVKVSIIPWPNHVAVSSRRPLPAGFSLQAHDPEAKAAARGFTALVEHLFAVEGIVRPEAEGAVPVALKKAAGFGPEAYRLSFEAETITIEASSQGGFFYGLVTLGHIWRGARLHPQVFQFPARGEIVDEPSMGWRGLHLDVARQFYAAAEIRKLVAILAWNKLNRFHWHLSDDEAWRVEIDAYPALTQIGAWRGHGLAVPPLLGSSPARSGGYYTKSVIREIVASAQGFGVEIVPEIDMPGHCHAMQLAIPELRDPDELGSYYSVQGFPDNCINPALEKTYEVVETILDELIDLFPFKTIHIGADEVPVGAWSGSPIALERLRAFAGDAVTDRHAKRLNVITNKHGADDIDGSGAAILQAEFLERIQRFLARRGCVTGGWEEAAHGDRIDKANSYLCGWRNVEVSAGLAERGYEMVVCPGQVYYLDMALRPDWDEPGASWAGNSDTETLYGFDPVQGWTEAQKEKLRGIQACIWSEPMTDRAVFDRLVFPRLSALAETGWTKPSSKSWERFRALAGLMPLLYGQLQQS
ncbi:beta-N-acetylhexosaminidase [Mesorhizobium sp. INR15]|uniref:beta-N-acetylhexosaminidase n=1 Tax=Mesorhizobium sp. INR15 TaxID=2654248 RepID=UPI0018964E62|nr:beta-N-acetylhexosaminidase [Mesorhizobium sp. INR15]QPC93473.1 family 20 glycosylhydrolase [Mesorhizobium sp. INR15]